MLRKKLPHFTLSELNQKVQKLFDYIKELEERLKAFEDKNARVKKIPRVPSFLPAKEGAGSTGVDLIQKKRGGSQPGVRRSKTDQLVIHETKII